MPRPPGAERPSRTYKQSPEFLTARTALGARARALRLARGLTLEAAAERMELDFKHLQKVEAGKVNVTLVTLVRLARGLDVALHDLFDFESDLPSALGSAPGGYDAVDRSLARAADRDADPDPDGGPPKSR